MSKLIIIRGVPGSGKSTRARELVEAGEADLHFEADQYFEDDQGNYNWNQGFISQAHQQCRTRTFRGLKAGKNVVVANTFIRKKSLDPYLAMAKRQKFDVEVIDCDGGYDNVHDVPDNVVARMKEQWEEFDE